MKKHLKGYLPIVLIMTCVLMIIIGGMVSLRALAAKNKATTIRLVRTEGNVTIKNSKDEEVVQTDEMRLFSGDHQITDEASYAWLSLDDTKAIKLDENSETELRKKWFKLEVMLNSGSVFFNVTVPLAKEETLNIRTSTMITGVRGTCGWLRVMDGGDTRVYLLEGSLECLVTNPMNGESKTITLKPGQYADFYVFDEDHPGDLTQIVPNSFGKEDIEPYVLVELIGDTDLVNKIYEQSGIDLRDLGKENAEKKKEQIQKDKAEEKKGIRGKAAEQDGIVSKDPVWDDNGNGDNDSIVYLTMPQTATTVQRFLDEKKVKKVVLLPGDVTPEENTLKVDIDFNTPAGKTLETRRGVPIVVLEKDRFVVEGTSLLKDMLTNNGTMIVNSANTLDARGTVINHGTMENTKNGRIVLGEQLISDGMLKNAGLIEQGESASGDSLIVINGGDFQITDGVISAAGYKTILEVKSGVQSTLSLEGGSISNDKEGGTTISVSTDDFKVAAMGTDVSGVTDTILGEKVDLSAYEAATVWRTDGKYHLIALSEVESYPVIVVNVEHGKIYAPTRVEVGATVPLIVVADDGYELDMLEVCLYADYKVGAPVGLLDANTFVMPRSNVIIKGSFRKIGEEPENKNPENNDPENEDLNKKPTDNKVENGNIYAIAIRGITHGTVKASVDKAKEKESIYLTVTPEVGYEFKSLNVKTDSGIEIGVSAKENGYSFTMPAENVGVTASFQAKKYTVTFYDANGSTVLSKGEYAYGTIPTYSGNTPKKGSTKQYDYSFTGWKNENGQSYGLNMPLPAVTGNESYIAQYKENQITYSVTWKDEDGTVLRKDDNVPAGSIPTYGNVMPTKAKDVRYTYTFKAWTDETANYNAGTSLPELTGDVTYRALYIGTVNQYEVTFVGEDGTTVLQPATKYDYGTAGTLITKPAEPAKASTVQNDYAFAGWSDGTNTYVAASIPNVTGNVTYKAVFSESVRKYGVTFVDDDGTVLRARTEYAYGTTGSSITKPTDPVKTSTAQYDFTFTGWSDGTRFYAAGSDLAGVTGDVTYQASYANKLRSYGVTFVDHDGTVLKAEKIYDFGTAAADIEKPADPVRANDGTYIYTFTGWTPAITAVSGTVTYTATYSTEDVVHVTSVAINERRTGLTLVIGGMTTGSLSATVLPADATNKNVTWSVDDPTILTVTGTGNTASVTALKSGVANVTVTSEDGLKKDTMKVTVNAKVTGVSLDKTNMTVMLGKTEDLTATIAPANATNQNVVWSSEDDTVATITADATNPLKAVITPKKVGTTKVNVKTVDGNFAAECSVTVDGYTVVFKNNDAANTVLKTLSGVAYGDTPSYGTGTPTKAATAQYSYTFDGWTDGVGQYRISTGTATLPPVTDNVTYTAIYQQSVNEYTVTWVNEDGTVLETDANVPYGTAAAYNGATPAKTGDAQYSYVFAGWNKTVTSVTGDETIMATYTQVVNKYKVTWTNYDGAILEEDDNIPYGDMPSYDSTTPTRVADAEYTYTFASWTPVITSVTGDVTYTATYSKTKNQYTIIFRDDDGSLLSSARYEYGTAAADITKPANPTKSATVQYTYTFKGWDPLIESVTGDATYTADYAGTLNKYTVTFVQMDDSGNATTLSSTAYDYGTEASSIVLPATPTKASSVSNDYTFNGYTPALSRVNGDATYTATFVSSVRQYTVTFKDEDGTTLSSTNYDYGTAAASITEPTGMTKAEDARYTYSFNGWDTAITSVTGDATYTATYKGTGKTYNVTLELNMSAAKPTINSGNVTDYTCGVGATLPTDVTLSGYRFEGWFTSATPASTDQPVTAIAADETGDKIYYAKWVAVYRISWLANAIPNGQIAADKTEAAEGEVVTVTVTPDVGYELNQLSYSMTGAVAGTNVTANTNGDYCFDMPAGDVSLNASFNPKVISGTLSIGGTQQVNKTLTATVTGGTNAGTLSYQWQRDGVDIAGATGETYTLVAIDYNTIITCVVTSSIETGTLEESTSAIAPAATVSLTMGTDTIDVATLNSLFADNNNTVIELKPGTDPTKNILSIDSDLTIPAGKTLVVDEGVVLMIGGANVRGRIINLSKNSIHNNGILVVLQGSELVNGKKESGVVCSGKIVNNEDGIIIIMGIFDSEYGTVTNNGKIFYQDLNAAEDGTDDIVDINADSTIKAMMLPIKNGGPVNAGTTKAVVIITKDEENSTSTETYYKAEFMGKGAVYEDPRNAVSVSSATYQTDWTSGVPKNISYLKTVVVDEGITGLESKQFALCTGLSSVTLPSTVTEIPMGAFYGCTSLTEFTIPATITTIGEDAFYGTGLTAMTIPGSVTQMKGAFRNMASLTKVTLSSGLETVSKEAFEECGNLTTVTFPASVKTIEPRAFYNTGIVNLTLAEGLESIGEEAFYNDIQATSGATGGPGPGPLKTVVIPTTLKTIAGSAFDHDDEGFAGISYRYDGTYDDWFRLKYENYWHSAGSDEYDPADSTKDLLPEFTLYAESTEPHTVSFVIKGYTNERFPVTPRLSDHINDNYTTADTMSAPFGTWIYYSNLVPYYSDPDFNYQEEYEGVFAKVLRKSDGTMLYHGGYDAMRYRGAFLMPDEDVVIELTYLPKNEKTVRVQTEAEFLAALDAKKSVIIIEYYDVELAGASSLVKTHITSGTTVYVGQYGYLTIGTNRELIVDEGACIHNYCTIRIKDDAENAKLTNNGTIIKYN